MMAKRCVRGYTYFFVYLLIWIASTQPTPSTSPTSASPSSIPTSNTLSPIPNPTANPTSNTPSPTIGLNCNTFNGKLIDPIVVQENWKISDLEIPDPLRITFNFTIASPIACSTDECNLIQFGSTNENILFPRISITNKTDNTFEWIFTLQMTTALTQSVTKTMVGQSFPYSSSFDIVISSKIVSIAIGSDTVYTSSTSVSIPYSTGLHPFYVSSDCCTALDANISQLCVSTDSSSPTLSPTSFPTITPTSSSPTSFPTMQPTDTLYTKIDCYTETGTVGESTVECSLPNYLPTSCGLTRDLTLNYNTLFVRGWYIQRANPNHILSEQGICHIEYDLIGNLSSVELALTPLARCCNFKQQYGDSFQCRYYSSADVIPGTTNTYNQVSSESGATTSNEFTYTSCNDNYPLLLGCTATILEAYNKITNIAFYGSIFPNQTNDYYQYYTLFPNKTIQYPPTTYTPTAYGNTPSPTATPVASVTNIKFDINNTEPYTPCVAQYGPITKNYTLIAVATCCTESYQQSYDSTCCTEPTSHPTAMPTISPVLTTATFGRGVNFGITFEQTGTDGPITAINEWGIVQVTDQTTTSLETYIPYQAILISQYQIYDYATNAMEQIIADTDYGQWSSGEFELLKECASFELDTVDGTRDYIIGFDVFWTRFAIFGIRFYSNFNRVYSCPDDQVFSDTSIVTTWIDPLARPSNSDATYNVRTNDYNMSNTSSLSPFEVNGTYQLSGWKGTKQTRELGSGLERSVMANISFIFLLDPAAAPTAPPTVVPTISPTRGSTPTYAPTAAPLLSGQSQNETLRCYSIWDKSNVSCSDNSNDTMTSCNGFSVTDQVLSTHIVDSTSKSVCTVETVDNAAEVAAIAVCCAFFIKAARDYNIFVWTTITGAVLYFVVILVIFVHWYFFIRQQIYFRESDIDKDQDIDKAWEEVGQSVAQQKVEQHGVGDKAHKEMLEMQRKASESIGLEAD